MSGISFYSAESLYKLLDYKSLIDALDQAFVEAYKIPTRHHHNYSGRSDESCTLLLMPAWQKGNFLGVKLVTITPDNAKYKRPTIQGIYILLNANTGEPLAQMDAPALTNIRTAATSALASKYLSKPESNSLLMIGTGSLAPDLIKAHAQIRPIREVYIWGRDKEKAQQLSSKLNNKKFSVQPIDSIEEGMSRVDIISCATLSSAPLIHGAQLKEGQHIDLVGSYKPVMREADDKVILAAKLYVDTYKGACKESGDLAIPLAKGIIKEKDIQAELSELCSKQKVGRQSSSEITLFKSVGYALEDLVAAKLAWERTSNKTI